MVEMVDKAKAFLSNITSWEFLKTISNYVMILILLLLGAGIIGYIIFRKKEKAKYIHSISYYTGQQGQLLHLKTEKAKEVIIPNTNIGVFYTESKRYVPRGTILSGKNAYRYYVTKSGDLINFSIKDLGKDLKSAGFNYEHVDMRYANENLRKIIDNYRKQNIPLWREYKDVITNVIYIFVLTLSFIFIIGKLGGLVGQMSVLVDKISSLSCITNHGVASGVVNAGVNLVP